MIRCCWSNTSCSAPSTYTLVPTHRGLTCFCEPSVLYIYVPSHVSRDWRHCHTIFHPVTLIRSPLLYSAPTVATLPTFCATSARRRTPPNPPSFSTSTSPIRFHTHISSRRSRVYQPSSVRRPSISPSSPAVVFFIIIETQAHPPVALDLFRFVDTLDAEHAGASIASVSAFRFTNIDDETTRSSLAAGTTTAINSFEKPLLPPPASTS